MGERTGPCFLELRVEQTQRFGDDVRRKLLSLQLLSKFVYFSANLSLNSLHRFSLNYLHLSSLQEKKKTTFTSYWCIENSNARWDADPTHSTKGWKKPFCGVHWKSLLENMISFLIKVRSEAYL